MKQLIVVAAILTACASAPADAADFVQDVLPILQDRCFGCHGPDKQKAGLRLDTKDGMFLEDDIVVAEKPDDSELVRRIALAADDEERMPRKGDPLSADQIQLVRDWIAAGAVWPAGSKSPPLTAKIVQLALPASPPPPSITEAFTSLFDGQSLDGWETKGGDATYVVEDGAIVGTSARNTPNTFLCTKQRYGDFILSFEFLCDQELNSGVQFRSECYAEDTTVTRNGQQKKFPAGRVHGYQAEIDPNQPDRLWFGGIYDEARRGWLFPGPQGGDGEAFTEQGKRLFKPGDWNAMRIECRGDHIRTWLNDELRADFHDDVSSEGLIGLQVHGVGDRQEPLRVRWRNLVIRELSAAE